GLQLLSGRYFDQQFKESEREKAILVNEKLLADFGWDKETAIGQKLKEKDTIDLTIVGVFENFYPYGFWAKIEPTMLKLGVKERMRMLVAQADEQNLKAVNEYMQSEWEKVIPNSVYPGFFQKDTLAEAKDINRQIKNIFLFMAIVSVILSLIGLYTLVSLNIIRKTKEIGIRKVLGASFFNLAKIINRDFVIILLIASVLGSALGYYLSEMLLASIWTIYLDTSVFSFIIPVVFIFLVSMISLSGKVYRAATRNPVDSIKYE
ncbi:MAG: FtsX-like permease family protein, partial [Bacteroidota bacterium]|nr:FtsX-like permease family protein [Bacteroidota bacterium]